MPEKITLADVLSQPRFYTKDEYRQGLYRAKVLRVDDPESRGRIQVRILHLHPESEPPKTTGSRPNQATQVGVELLAIEDPNELRQVGGQNKPGVVGTPSKGVPDGLCPWAEPCFPWGGNLGEGFFALPSVGSTVWVGFELGFTGKPVWLGCWYGSGELPQEITDPAYVRILKTPAGHLILFDDTPDNRVIIIRSVGGREIIVNDQTQSIQVRNGSDTDRMLINSTETTIFKGSNKIQLLASGELTIVTSGDVNVNAAGSVKLGTGAALGVVLETLLTIFNTHTHNDPVSGVTGPPNTLAVPGVDSSSTVLAKT